MGRVQDALAVFESEKEIADGGAAAAAVVRAAREAVHSLQNALDAEREAAVVSTTGEAPAEIGRRVRESRTLVHRILETAARRELRLTLDDTHFADEWTDLILEAAVLSDYTVGDLFLSRARTMGDRTLFLLPPSRPEGRLSWAEAKERLFRIARALIAMRDRGEIGHGVGPVAHLGPNSPEIALFDLACLSVGVPNVPIPANSPPDQAAWILNHAGARVLFLGDERMADIAQDAIRDSEGRLRAYWLDEKRAERDPVRPLAEFLARGTTVAPERIREEVARVRSGDLATTMYTSGTTGTPRGIPFTQANLVTKRFARAAAWPDLGEGDVFLCYLPLYHTFGRWLEMMGCVFWSAVYAFIDDVSVESMLYSFQRCRPTTFISVPKKWIQLSDAATHEAEESGGGAAADDPDDDHEARAVRALARITGGRLKRGLSAAGYLSPEIFRRFHNAGIELHSGFGMTEATGGITMTPPGEYRDDSIGRALPGIELKVADDGELLIRGPYVTPEAEGDPPREDGWFATGDMVKTDREGHLQIYDRKKEIFKNVQGETISPRRIESLFAEFEIAERVVLIGDSRPYCTVLIVPSAELREEFAESGDSLTLEAPELHEMFAPIVSTVNRFLAPFERILDFAMLSRDLDPEQGELTAKNTPRRKNVAERFASVIDPLYTGEAVTLTVGDRAVRVPHWFLRQIGVPSTEVRVADDDDHAIELGGGGRRLGVRETSGGEVAIGDLVYDPGGSVVLLGEILGRAELWLGNHAVHEFAGPGIEYWWRRGRRFEAKTQLVDRRPENGAAPPEAAPPFSGIPDTGLDIAALHAFTRTLSRPDPEERHTVLDHLGASLTGEHPEMDDLVRDVLRTGLHDPDTRAHCLRGLIPGITPDELDEILQDGLADPTFLDPGETEILGAASLRIDQVEFLLQRVHEMIEAEGATPQGLHRLLRFLGEQAVHHRMTHLRVRSMLAVLLAEAKDSAWRAELEEVYDGLVAGFRASLPHVQRSRETPIEAAVVFEGDVSDDHRRRIREAIETSALLPEAMALLGPTAPRRPVELKASAVRVRYLGTGRGRMVYLLAWSPKGLDAGPPRFECVLKLNVELEWRDIREEHFLLVCARHGPPGRPVVKRQGGAYREHGLWTEEYVPGKTLAELAESLLAEGGDDGGRLPDLWQFLVSSSAALAVDFWNRTGRTITLAEPSPEKVVLPGHDWQIGGRLVSIARRVPCDRLSDVLDSVHRGIVVPLRRRFQDAGLDPTWRVLFSGALEILGEEEALDLLAEEAPWRRSPTGLGPAALRFVSSVRRRGFLPVRVRVAARRYRRWAHLNPEATLEARATTLDQIAAAYGLGELDVERPGTRLQLFRHTVFRRAATDLTRAFDQMIAQTVARGDAAAHGRWHDELATLRDRFPLDDHEEFFLARILYPHVDPRGHAVLVRDEEGGTGFATGVQVSVQDRLGEEYRIHPPRTPQEVSALSQIFRAERFRRVPVAGRDELLVLTNERRRVCGGLIFHRPSATYTHLEWMVVSRHRRKRGLGGALLGEFLERMRAQGVEAVSTGFFRPRFFAEFGFGVDPRYAGLVRILGVAEKTPPDGPEPDA